MVIIHTTPEFYSKYRENGKTNVAYTIWETSKLHPDWKGYINENVEKVLVGNEWNVGVFERSGVTVPIGVVPHGINSNEFDGIKPYNIGGVLESTYVFYSIFQWVERKHPVALIKAYWYAFQNPNDNVALILKTYRGDYSDTEKNAIRNTVRVLKSQTPMDYHPKLYLILDMLSQKEILGLHARGDCYASLDRGEGFGLSPFTAGACGNPIIVTGFGGSTEYAKENNSYLVDYKLTPVSGMPWSPWYRGDQLWAEPDVLNGALHMRYVYTNQNDSELKGNRLKEYIRKNFSWEIIGKKIIKELEEL
jgi:glycosyltransferase involved in cell wall biosynthesis